MSREDTTMTDTTLSRRRFITTALTAAGGFALGVGITGPSEAASLGVRPWGMRPNVIPARSTPGS
jgi:hypothetical protein